jgi:hypothetical protein
MKAFQISWVCLRQSLNQGSLFVAAQGGRSTIAWVRAWALLSTKTVRATQPTSPAQVLEGKRYMHEPYSLDTDPPNRPPTPLIPRSH